jgi:hypothetical protein
MNVIFLSPAYPPEMQQFTRGLAEVGARVIGVGDQHEGALPASLRKHLAAWIHVPKIMDEDDVVRRVAEFSRGKRIDRVETNWEPLTITAARLREQLGVPGMRPDTVLGFRDKPIMRERVGAAGIRIPKTRRVRTREEVLAMAEEVGFPLILKPVAGAGGADTWRVGSREELDRTLARIGHLPEASCEEFVEGRELTYETICIDGRPVYESVCLYVPNVLVARKNEWISPIILSLRDLQQPMAQAGIRLGREVLAALNMGTGFTHMEWYLKPNGEAVFGEIACRAPGALMVDVMNFTSDVDLFREWARATCWGAFDADATRKYSVAITFKRAIGEGRITRITGVDGFRQRFGRHIARIDLLPEGTPRRDWTQTFLSDGHVVVRHPDEDAALGMGMAAATDITLYAGG